jgi:hypothetical protein
MPVSRSLSRFRLQDRNLRATGTSTAIDAVPRRRFPVGRSVLGRALPGLFARVEVGRELVRPLGEERVARDLG